MLTLNSIQNEQQPTAAEVSYAAKQYLRRKPISLEEWWSMRPGTTSPDQSVPESLAAYIRLIDASSEKKRVAKMMRKAKFEHEKALAEFMAQENNAAQAKD